nr:hypothetical protein [Verrucomicrobiota bacterium]
MEPLARRKRGTNRGEQKAAAAGERFAGNPTASKGILPQSGGRKNVAESIGGDSWWMRASLNWGSVADVDLYLDTPTARIWYGNLEADGFTLNQDAYPACDEEPSPPEIITGWGGFGTYVVYSDLFSDCDEGGWPPLTFEAMVIASSPQQITINGVEYGPEEIFYPDDGVPFTVLFPAKFAAREGRINDGFDPPLDED